MNLKFCKNEEEEFIEEKAEIFEIENVEIINSQRKFIKFLVSIEIYELRRISCLGKKKRIFKKNKRGK